MIPAKIDSQELDAFFRVLWRVKDNDGHLDYKGIWFDPSREESPDRRIGRTKILNAHKETLRRLRKSLEKCLYAEEKARHSSSPLKAGTDVNSLPFEVISRIFLLSSSVDRDATTLLHINNSHPKSLSHVSRRFRDIALQTPCLWNTVAAGQPLKETQTYLERSQSSPLIVISDDQSRSSLPIFMAAVLPHAHRWAELYITVYPTIFLNCVPLAELCGDIQLPMLTVLQHHSFVSRPDDEEWEDLFSCGWTMPQLASYTAFNVVPKFYNQCVGHVKHCEWHWENSALSDDDEIAVDLWNLLINLKAMSNIRNLSLQFRHVSPIDDFDDFGVFELPFVESFTLALEGGPEVEEKMKVLFHSLKLPNVIELSLELRLECCRTNGLPFDLDMPDGPVYFSNLRQLHYEDHTPFRTVQLESMLHRCKSLVEFKLHAPRINLFRQSGHDVWSSHLPLETLHLTHCDVVSPRDVRCLANNLKGGPVWATFQKLEIRQCKKLSETFFLAIEDELEGKLDWRTAAAEYI
ncbi:hypothetical protein BD410DRAFT_792007 [Rickenella mellea]|uniref:Uncharacterized protein n=1 Tax=Rickenella mellea TaxID=50990 RepID=A0A4Y7PX70_9AGAM|nr:hypothetical protein BD410DRAFT_792007 [Rickenella mellea]